MHIGQRFPSQQAPLILFWCLHCGAQANTSYDPVSDKNAHVRVRLFEACGSESGRSTRQWGAKAYFIFWWRRAARYGAFGIVLWTSPLD
ncbi:hypothetical protein K438DRAFT_1880069 [Mycena galopus ATCC 62051]|nr:hypothetical protein K438DRAFT_1880069 [Mycena galopus ATCC 62051]